jgi:alpha-tubulin suppressor-like RCC1 family protein
MDTGAMAGYEDATTDGDDTGPGADSSSTLQAVAIAVGATHACAVVSDAPGSPENGTIRCWGANDSGQLGTDPATVPFSYRPVKVVGRGTPEQNNAASLTLAAGYSCTTTTDGYLLCWGNVPGGSGVTRQDSTLPYEPSQMQYVVQPLAQVASASMGPSGGCCTLQDQSLVCWGGDLAPTKPDGGVTFLDGGVIVSDQFHSVAVGRAHACGGATSTSSVLDVECWGANDDGQTGLYPSPVVSAPNHLGLAHGNLLQVAAGGNNSCALFDNGALYCWGADESGQLGPGGTLTSSQVPVAVTFPSTAVPIAIAVGDAHACAVLSDRSAWCWGDDSMAQLGGGPGGPSFSVTPSRVQRSPGHNLSGVARMAAGGRTTCVTLFGDTHPWCWGANDHGQAGLPPPGAVPYAKRVLW